MFSYVYTYIYIYIVIRICICLYMLVWEFKDVVFEDVVFDNNNNRFGVDVTIRKHHMMHNLATKL